MNDEALPQITVTDAMLQELAPMQPLSLRLSIAIGVISLINLVMIVGFMVSAPPWWVGASMLIPLAVQAYVAFTFWGIAKAPEVSGPMIRQLDRNMTAIFIKVVALPVISITLSIALSILAAVLAVASVEVRTDGTATEATAQ